jgi:hypothetical protein
MSSLSSLFSPSSISPGVGVTVLDYLCFEQEIVDMIVFKQIPLDVMRFP